MDGDTVTDFAHEVKACALGQASSSIMASHVVGAKADELRKLRDTVRKMLKENGEPPKDGKWADIAVLEPVRDYKARHASTMLTFDAVVDAIGQIEGKRRRGGGLTHGSHSQSGRPLGAACCVAPLRAPASPAFAQGNRDACRRRPRSAAPKANCRGSRSRRRTTSRSSASRSKPTSCSRGGSPPTWRIARVRRLRAAAPTGSGPARSTPRSSTSGAATATALIAD